MEQIGERIVKLRKMNNLTQEKLANKLFISNKAVSKWESNKGCPSNEMILRLSEVFNCSTDYLLLGENLQNINIEFDKKYSNE